MRLKYILAPTVVLALGCATTYIKPFVMSDEAMMSRVAMEIPFGTELKEFFSTHSDRSVVVVNIENNKYNNDQNPEYILDDAIYARLTAENVKIHLLDRDPDVLQVLIAERKGKTIHPETNGEDNADSLTPEQRRQHIGKLISNLIGQLAPQDVLVHHQVTGQAKQPMHSLPTHVVGVRKRRRGKRSIAAPLAGEPVVSPEIIANELGPQKAALLRHLLGQYMSLFPTTAAKKGGVKLGLTTADYLLAYRIYEFGPWSNPVPQGGIERTTYAKIHLRIIDMKTGRIVASDFMEHSIVDSLSNEQFATLRRTKATSADYRRPAARTAPESKAVTTSGSDKPAKKKSKLNPLNWFGG